ncbi:EspF repeat-containing protein [Streptomyces sp. DT2A-34]
MSRVIRRAPNWARSRPPLRTKCSRPRGDAAKR